MHLLKVMLVDDEILALSHLKSLIQWEEQGLEIVAECTNPVKALQLAKTEAPDVVIVDIRMPVMDGLEFSRKLLAVKRQVKILLLTSYKDFEYAKQAVEIGVSNYLLKHELHADKLIEEFGNIKKQLHKQRNMDHIIAGKIIRDLLAEKKAVADELLNLQFEDENRNCHFIFLLLQLDMPFPVLPYRFDKDIPIGEITGNMEFPPDMIHICTAVLGSNLWGILLRTREHISQRQIWGKVTSMAYVIQKSMKEKYRETISIVATNIFKGLTDLPVFYSEAKKAAQYSVYFGREKVLHHYEVDRRRIYRAPDFKHSLSSIERHLEEQNSDKLAVYLSDMFQSISADYCDIEDIRGMFHRLVNILDLFRQKNHLAVTQELLAEGRIDTSQWYTISGICQWFLQVYACAVKEVRRLNLGRYSKKVQQIVQYICEHFAEDISVCDLGERFGMSGDYLRHIFKEETNQTILDFITEVRINRSKKLLESGNYKIYEIAEMVGYKTAQYFSQVFKKTLGMNPYEYMEGSSKHAADEY